MTDLESISEQLSTIERVVRENGERGSAATNLLTRLVLDMRHPTENLAEAATFLVFFDTIPVPAWLKLAEEDGSLKMRWINAAYEKVVGVSSEDYVGKNDLAVWSQNIAEDFEANDRKVIETFLPVQTTEAPTGQIWRGYKWPYIIDNKVCGVFGIALGTSK